MHKQTKATSIPAAVKRAVWERDGGRCVLCGKQGNPWCHYISRAQGGLGIEQNIVTLCDKCHNDFDQSAKRRRMKEYIKWYLKMIYPDWDEMKLFYKKGM